MGIPQQRGLGRLGAGLRPRLVFNSLLIHLQRPRPGGAAWKAPGPVSRMNAALQVRPEQNFRAPLPDDFQSHFP